ncbi:RNA-directed DNA polymerase (Reverse transcriptase), Ribonuclease H [Gossypium australe]|uniref:RNA-directed DNA polymerase (Reverse transcriptase), Ribonuclease H n=1 Tax=Gossypium australe TaxID=47621 RepID=A0A5B6VUC9_9ROSI|nr:RNA-directed DNA polymerase (Reverse transcriptase), Ribonuclease H [Gossypium australe]
MSEIVTCLLLLRMVEQDEKQILPHKESVEIVSLEDEPEKKDVFAWSYQDMPGLSTNIVVHRLPIKEECKLVQQKLRKMRPDVLLEIKEKVKKHFDVANVVPVPKRDGKVRMCVDCPKENFSLPHIDTLVDNMAGHSLFSFMDGFSGYNQIKIHPEDMEKTTFITM